MFKNILKVAVVAATFVPSAAFAGEIGVSHSVANSVRSGTGQLTVNSVTNSQVNERSISFTGQLSGARFDYLNGDVAPISAINTFTGNGNGNGNNGNGNGNNGNGNGNGGNSNASSLGVSGALGSGGVGQLSASIATRNLASTNTTTSNLIENYSFADSVFTQTSSTFSR